MTVQLGPRYYLEHFESVLAHVEAQYGDWFCQEERRFVSLFRSLSVDAQCLFVRMNNRRGEFFRRDRLRYAEIEDCALEELLQHGAASALGGSGPVTDLLPLLKKSEWVEVLGALGVDGLSRLKKEELWTAVLSLDSAELRRELIRRYDIVQIGFVATVESLTFMFFGGLDGHLSEFVARDVGHIRPSGESASYVRRFSSRQEIDDSLAVARLARAYHDRKDEPPEELFAWLLNWRFDRASLAAAAREGFDALLARIARALERAKLWPLALHAYELSAHPSTRERRARVLHRLKRNDAALRVCEEILGDPRSPKERQFAEDFSGRLRSGKRTKRSTEALRQAECVVLQRETGVSVEESAARWYRAQGYSAVHAENSLWRLLFALTFWELLCDDAGGAYHHPLQRGPSDLFRAEFSKRRGDGIENALQALRDRERGRALLRQRFEAHFGVSMPLVRWDETTFSWALELYERLSWHQLRTILTEMADDLRHHSSGFPDLFVWDASEALLIEVKSETDTLSGIQLHWLSVFARLGVEARVLKVIPA